MIYFVLSIEYIYEGHGNRSLFVLVKVFGVKCQYLFCYVLEGWGYLCVVNIILDLYNGERSILVIISLWTFLDLYIITPKIPYIV